MKKKRDIRELGYNKYDYKVKLFVNYLINKKNKNKYSQRYFVIII